MSQDFVENEEAHYAGVERRSVRRLDDRTHEKHHAYLDAFLQKEASRASLRKAVIEKTFAGLIWTGIAFLGHRIATYWAEHFK